MVFIVIVCLDPNEAHLKAVTDCIISAGCKPVVVDNSEQDHAFLHHLPGCELIQLGSNTGIAYAQNRGIEHALSQGAGIIGFFDQDSLVDTQLISVLKGATGFFGRGRVSRP